MPVSRRKEERKLPAGKKRLASEVHWITAMLSVIPNGKPYHRFLEKGEAIALKMTVAN